MQVGSRVSGDSAFFVDQSELPLMAETVVIEKYINRLLWGGAAPQQHQAGRSVSGISEPLGRDDADLGFAVGDEAPHPRKLGLNGHAQVAVGGVIAEDRVRHGPPPRTSGSSVGGRASAKPRPAGGEPSATGEIWLFRNWGAGERVTAWGSRVVSVR